MDEPASTSLIDTTLDSWAVIATILDSISDGIIVVGKDSSIRAVNTFTEKLLGFKTHDIIGKPLDGLFSLEDSKENPIPSENLPWKVAREQGKSLPPTLYAIVKPDGDKKPVSLSVTPLFPKDQKVVDCLVLVFEDKASESEVERMKTEFIPFAAHQLRTPLGSIRWNTEMILSGKIGVVPHYLKDTIANIYDSAQQMIRLVNDLLNLSRIDEGEIPNDPVDIDVGSVIRSVVHETQTLMEKRAVTAELTIPQGLPNLRLDAGRFRDVIQNVVSNAVKFNKPGGKITVTVTSSGGIINIVVADTGMGIPKEEQKRIFAKFFRAKNAVANQTEGTGLGLYVIKYFMDQWGGSINLESEEEKGTTVHLIFPVTVKE